MFSLLFLIQVTHRDIAITMDAFNGTWKTDRTKDGDWESFMKATGKREGEGK